MSKENTIRVRDLMRALAQENPDAEVALEVITYRRRTDYDQYPGRYIPVVHRVNGISALMVTMENITKDEGRAPYEALLHVLTPAKTRYFEKYIIPEPEYAQYDD